MRKFSVLGFVLFSLVLFSCNRQVKNDAERLAELFCKQSKIISDSPNLHDSKITKQLAEIEKEAESINSHLQKEYSNDIDAMETFAKTYQEGIKNCK